MVWEGVYGQDKGTGSLNYISLGVGFIIGLQLCGRLVDTVRPFNPPLVSPNIDPGLQKA
jgi:hypothetical protein